LIHQHKTSVMFNVVFMEIVPLMRSRVTNMVETDRPLTTI